MTTSASSGSPLLTAGQSGFSQQPSGFNKDLLMSVKLGHTRESTLDQLFSPHHRCTVMSTPRMQPLAEEVVGLCPEILKYSKIDWSYFPDGTPNIKMKVEDIHHRDVLFIVDIDMSHMMPLLSVMHSIPRYLARTFHVIIGYFQCGTMERVEAEGEIATAKTLARLLSVTPNPQIGEPCFHIFDIHALASRFFFSDNVKINLITGVPVMQSVLATDPDFKPKKEGGKFEAVIVFPDDGAYKRFRIFFPSTHYDRAIFVKVRKGDERLLMPVEGEEFVKDRNCIVIDDICMSGGTLMGTANELQKRGAKSVSLYTTHGVFPRQSWKRFLPSAMKKAGLTPLRAYYMTNSFPTAIWEMSKNEEYKEYHEECKSFYKVLTLSGVIRDIIVGTQSADAVSPQLELQPEVVAASNRASATAASKQ